VPFAYYRRLTRGQQRIYRQSDEVAAVRLTGVQDLRPLVDALAVVLEHGDRAAIQASADRLLARMTVSLGVAPLRAEVQAVRPSSHWGELHGLYTPGSDGRLAQVTVWMRTARRHQVVKFRTFLRTLLHELGHHLDYEMLGLPDSFHTEGFYKRESSLLRQLLGSAAGGEAP
jgi:hypothetical protein